MCYVVTLKLGKETTGSDLPVVCFAAATFFFLKVTLFCVTVILLSILFCPKLWMLLLLSGVVTKISLSRFDPDSHKMVSTTNKTYKNKYSDLDKGFLLNLRRSK